MSFECLKGWGCFDLSGHPVQFFPVSNCSFSFCSLHMLSLVLPLCSCKKSLVLSSFRQLKTAIRPPFSLLQAEQGRVSLLPCKDELLTRVPFAGAGVLFQQSFLASWFPVCPFARGSSVPGAILCICFC